MIPNKEFLFSYVNNKNSVTYDGQNLLCKIGPFRKRVIPFNNIQHYYVFENKSYRVLYITWLNDKGKLQRVGMFTHLGEIGFRDLIEELNNSIGSKGLNHLPEDEAFKAMKAANPKKWAPVAGFVIILIITTSSFYPGLRHYFDFGFRDAEVQQLIAGDDLGTRNLNLSGVPLSEAVEETTQSGSRNTTNGVFVPLVPPDWSEGQPVHVIMKFDKLSDEEYNAVLESSEFTGVVRDIGYEGLGSDHRQAFSDEFDLEVPDDAILFEVTRERHNDGLKFWLWLGINGFFVIIFAAAVIKNR